MKDSAFNICKNTFSNENKCKIDIGQVGPTIFVDYLASSCTLEHRYLHGVAIYSLNITGWDRISCTIFAVYRVLKKDASIDCLRKRHHIFVNLRLSSCKCNVHCLPYPGMINFMHLPKPNMKITSITIIEPIASITNERKTAIFFPEM